MRVQDSAVTRSSNTGVASLVGWRAPCTVQGPRGEYYPSQSHISKIIMAVMSPGASSAQRLVKKSL
jgi:hypothetical protein